MEWPNDAREWVQEAEAWLREREADGYVDVAIREASGVRAIVTTETKDDDIPKKDRRAKELLLRCYVAKHIDGRRFALFARRRGINEEGFMPTHDEEETVKVVYNSEEEFMDNIKGWYGDAKWSSWTPISTFLRPDTSE